MVEIYPEMDQIYQKWPGITKSVVLKKRITVYR